MLRMDTIALAKHELDLRRGDWPAICEGADLSYWWLTKFAQGRIQEPGLRKIERLQKYFREHPRAEQRIVVSEATAIA